MAYISQDKKATVAAALKTIMPAGWKWSLAVRNHMSLVLTIQAAPVDLIAEVNRVGAQRSPSRRENPASTYTNINTHYPESAFDGALLELFTKVLAAMNDGNHDRSDLQTDYFDVGWYVDICIGRWDRPFICTAAAVAA